MPVDNDTPWLVDGFAVDGPPSSNRLKKALTDKYDFSVRRGGTRTRVQENVAFVFHYVFFFRDLYAYDAQVLKAAAEDLGIADSYQCEGIFRRYLDAREEYTSDPNNPHIPATAPESDKMLCGIVDNVIALMAVEREMSEQQLKGKIAARRKNWKMVVKEWMRLRITKEPFFPNNNGLLVQLMEKAEAARGDTDESTQDAVEDDEEATMADDEDMGKEKKGKGKEKEKGAGDDPKAATTNTESSSPDATIQALAGLIEEIGEDINNQDAATTNAQTSSPDATTQPLADGVEERGEGIANQDAADNDQMATESDEMISLRADAAIDHQLYAAIDPNSTPTVAQELIPINPPYDWRLTDLVTLNIIGAWREPAQQLAQHLDAVARDSRNPWRTRFFHWMMARSLCEFIRWFDRFAVDARQGEE